MNSVYDLINSFIATKMNNVDKINLLNKIKKYPYIGFDNNNVNTIDDEDYVTVFFTKKQDTCIFSETQNHYVVSDISGNNDFCISIFDFKVNDIPSGIYETNKIVVDDFYHYSFNDIIDMPVLDSRRLDLGSILSSFKDDLSFEIDCSSEEKLYSVPEVKIEDIYSNLTDYGKYGYVVSRVLFNEKVIGYVTQTGRYLETQDFVILDVEGYTSFIEFVENLLYKKKEPFSQSIFENSFAEEFLFAVEKHRQEKQK